MSVTLPQVCGLCACRLADGRCHRFPPAINHPNRDRSAWPVVDEAAAGCFEFRAAHLLAVPEVQEDVRKTVAEAVKNGEAKAAESGATARPPEGKRKIR